MNPRLSLPAPDKVQSTCPYCGVGCGVSIDVSKDFVGKSKDKRTNVEVSGDVTHPANAGKLCSKGLALGQTLSLTGRLLTPEIDNRACEWDEATSLIASQLSKTISEYGPDSVAFYVSGQLLTEDYYVVNKLIKGYLGTANIDTNSRLCMASSVAGHKRAFGSDTVPGVYSDIESADLIVLTGSNLAWCHPILQQRISAAKEANDNLKVIVIDPRKTATAELADIHLSITPDSDAALFNGLLSFLVEKGAIDKSYVDAHTVGLSEALAAAHSLSTVELAKVTGLSVGELHSFFSLFAATKKVMTLYSQGVNQSSSGTDKVNSILNCHLATGRIGKPGMGPFSVTGQPNAMGGREVGGLSNMLAAHMELDNVQHQHLVQQFWKSPELAKKSGLKAVDLFKAVRERKIKFLWIMATNPVVSMPDADSIKTALSTCPFVVVSDVVRDTDTLAFADVKLPAAAWGEKDGTVTNSERRISRQRAFRSLPSKAKPDWWAVCEVAKKLGHTEAFSFRSSADIFREHAALSGFRNDGSRDFDISACEGMTNASYDAMQPFIWPWSKTQSEDDREQRFFANGGFFTKDRKARIIPIKSLPNVSQQLEFVSEPTQTTQREKPLAKKTLIMNTGRVRDQWHTMSRTGYVPILSAHYSEPFVEISPADAQQHGIKTDDIVRVANSHGSVLLRAIISDGQPSSSIFTPMHWSQTHASFGRVNALVPNSVDPVSGQPASKSALVTIEKYKASSFTFAIVKDWSCARRVIERQQSAQSGEPFYWSRSICKGGWRVEIASQLLSAISTQYWRHELLASKRPIMDMDDSRNQVHRLAYFDDTGLQAAVFCSAVPERSSRHWVAEQLGKAVDESQRYRIMAGQPAGAQPDNGAIVCSCFMVGKKQIQRCVSENACVLG